MAKTVLFVQGAGEGTHDDWDVKLTDSLKGALGPDFVVRYPQMPEEADPRYDRWSRVLYGELALMRDGDVLVGHSAGGATLIHLLAGEEVGFRPGGLALIAAPYVGEGGWRLDDMPAQGAFGPLLPKGMPVSLWQGEEDEIVPPGHARLYAKSVPQAALHLLPGRDHQLNEDMRDVARWILEEC